MTSPAARYGAGQATVATIRTKLIKIGAVIERKLSVVRLHLSSACPLQSVFRRAARVIYPG